MHARATIDHHVDRPVSRFLARGRKVERRERPAIPVGMIRRELGGLALRRLLLTGVGIELKPAGVPVASTLRVRSDERHGGAVRSVGGRSGWFRNQRHGC